MSRIGQEVIRLEEAEAEANAQYVIVARHEKLIDCGDNDWDWGEYESYATLQNARDRLQSVIGGRIAKLTFIGVES